MEGNVVRDNNLKVPSLKICGKRVLHLQHSARTRFVLKAP